MSMNHRWRRLIGVPEPNPHEWTGNIVNPTEKHTWWNDDCTARHCHGKKIAGEVAYDYITGRAGRITDSRKFLCAEHLAAWIKRHPEAGECAAVDYETARGRVFSISNIENHGRDSAKGGQNER